MNIFIKKHNICVFILILIFVFITANQAYAGEPRIVKAGALIPGSGIWSEKGKEQAAVIKLAVEQINFYLAKSDIKLELVIKDSESNPDTIASKMQDLKREDVDVVIGPFTSAEAEEAVKFANENDMLLISPSSTAPTLALDDNLIRLAPNDNHQSRAMAMLLERDGIEVVIPVYMDDVYGKGLFNALSDNFTGREQTVSNGIAFDPSAPDYDIILQTMETEIRNSGTETAAVYLVSTAFQAVSLFNKIPEHSDLLQVNWYASDSYTGSEVLLNDKIAAKAATLTNLTGLTFSVHDIYFYIYSWLIMQMVEDEIGAKPLPTVLATWDALWLTAETFRNVTTNDFAEFKEKLISMSTDYFGAYGFGGLDKNGDKVEARYNIKSVEGDTENGLEWKVTGNYIDPHYWKQSLIRSFKDRSVEKEGTVNIGALLDLSGFLSAQGKINRKVLDLASNHINRYLSSKGSGMKLAVETHDTIADPEVAQENAQLLNSKGAKVIVGPLSSSETAGVGKVIKETGQSVISPSSTTPSLALDDDNIMRLVSTDIHQGKAIAELMTIQGIKTVFVVCRDDIYGNDLLNAFDNEFAGDIKFIIRYEPSQKRFNSLIKKLNAEVKRAGVRENGNSTAVLAIGFGEVIDMFKHFYNKSPLAKVRWYGTDGIALNSELINNKKVAAMAEAVSFTTSVYDLNALGLFLPQMETMNFFLESTIGEEVSAFTANMYDALWIAALGYERAGSLQPEPDKLWVNLNGAANWTYGMSTPLFLDANSDRADATYGFYTVRKDKRNYIWKLVATHRNTGFSTSGISIIVASGNQ